MHRYVLLFIVLVSFTISTNKCKHENKKDVEHTNTQTSEVDSIGSFLSIEFGSNKERVQKVMSSKKDVDRTNSIGGSYNDNSDYSNKNSPLGGVYLTYQGGTFAGLQVSKWKLTLLKEEFVSGRVEIKTPTNVTRRELVKRIKSQLSDKYGSYDTISNQLGTKIVYRLEDGRVEFITSGKFAPTISYISHLQERYVEILTDEFKKQQNKNIKHLMDKNSDEL